MSAGNIDGKQGWTGPIAMGNAPVLVTAATSPTQRVNKLWVPYLTTIINADSDAENASALVGLDLTKPFTAAMTWVVNPGYGPSLAGDWPEFMFQFGGDDGGATDFAVNVEYNPDSTAVIEIGNNAASLLVLTVSLPTTGPHELIAAFNGTSLRVTLDGISIFSGVITAPATWGNQTVYVCEYGKPNPQQNLVQSITVQGTHV